MGIIQAHTGVIGCVELKLIRCNVYHISVPQQGEVLDLWGMPMDIQWQGMVVVAPEVLGCPLGGYAARGASVQAGQTQGSAEEVGNTREVS